MYDAWGNVLRSTQIATGGSAANNVNPFRYRGYYYDTETQLYYLQSRYYNPQWGRFLNADGYFSTGTGLLGHNMYAYCNNNPVMEYDPSGKFPWHILIGAAISAGVDLTSQLIQNGGNLRAVDIKSVLKSGIQGAISSAIGGFGDAGVKALLKCVKKPVSQFVIKVAGKMATEGLSDVAAKFFTNDITSLGQAIGTFVDGAMSGFVSMGIDIKLRQYNEYKFNGLSLKDQKDKLTNKIFKNGNYYENWTWNTFRSSDQFNAYLNSGEEMVGYIWDATSEFFGS